MHIYIRAGDISSTLLSTNNDEHFWGTCKKCFITTIRIKVSWKFKKEPSQPSSLTIISLSLSPASIYSQRYLQIHAWADSSVTVKVSSCVKSVVRMKPMKRRQNALTTIIEYAFTFGLRYKVKLVTSIFVRLNEDNFSRSSPTYK